jgi:predicted Zn-dependent peptidase
MAQLLLYGLPDNYFDTFAMRVGDVDVEQVRDVAVRHLNPGKLATAIVAVAALVGPQLTRAGLGEPAPLLPRL